VSAIVVPEEVARPLREWVRIKVLGAISEDIAQMTLSEHSREAYAELTKRFCAAEKLLDRIGWGLRGAPAELNIDLEQHGSVILEALRAICGSGSGQESKDAQEYGADVELNHSLIEFLVLVEECCGSSRRGI
jgi:hypothetical protein